MKIKACALDADFTSYKEVKERNVIAQGWYDSGDISFFTNENDINCYVDLIEGKNTKYLAFNKLIKDIQKGDIVLAFEGSQIKGVCEVPSDFVYVYQKEYDYANAIFPVKWVDWNDLSLEKAPSGFRPRNPIFNIYRSDIHSFVTKCWEEHKKKNKLQIQQNECQEKLNEIKSMLPQKIKESKAYYNKLLEEKKKHDNMKDSIALLTNNKNLILTGAPGTGKTYLAREIAKMMTGKEADEHNLQYCFVQFHPSYDYTDFVEGLRPYEKDDVKEIGFRLKNGIFMDFCKEAKKAFAEDSNKSEDEKRKFIFIIDEINRAEISKVFGELFFSIDPGYRGEKGKVKTQYANLRDNGDQYFYVPENVYIIGTMNDIDRSVESFDFAMRRRFAWKEISASQKMFDSTEVWKAGDGSNIEISDKIISLVKQRMTNLNNAILKPELGLNSSYQIGAAYFLKLGLYLDKIQSNSIEAFKSLWDNHIGILLFEYFRGTPINGNLNELEKAFNLEIIYNNDGQPQN